VPDEEERIATTNPIKARDIRIQLGMIGYDTLSGTQKFDNLKESGGQETGRV